MGLKFLRQERLRFESIHEESVEVSDEGDPQGNGGSVCAVRRRVVANHMFHHGVFGHVLHEVRLLERNKEKDRESHTTAKAGWRRSGLTGGGVGGVGWS